MANGIIFSMLRKKTLIYLAAATVTVAWEQKELFSITSLNKGLIGSYK